MKRVNLVLAVICVATAANSQIFIGGSFGFANTKEKTPDNVEHKQINETNWTEIEFAPKLGIYAGEKTAAGLFASFYKGSSNFGSGSASAIDEVSKNMWKLGAFFRPKLTQVNNFSLLLDFSLAIGGGKSESIKNENSNIHDKFSIFEVKTVPVLSYSIKEKVNIEAICDILGFMYHSKRPKNDIHYEVSTDKTINTFILGIKDGHQSYGNPQFIKIGLIFNFGLSAK